MPHCPNLNDTPSLGPLTKADFPPEPAEAATDVGQEDIVMPYDKTEIQKGAWITLICFAITVAVIAIGAWLRT